MPQRGIPAWEGNAETASDSFSVLKVEVRAGAPRIPLTLYRHSPGGAFCLCLFSRQRKRGSERLSRLHNVTQLVSDICWTHIKDLHCVSSVQTLNFCLMLSLVTQAHGRHWRKPRCVFISLNRLMPVLEYSWFGSMREKIGLEPTAT